MPSRSNSFPNNILEPSIFDFEIPSFEDGNPIANSKIF